MKAIIIAIVFIIFFSSLFTGCSDPMDNETYFNREVEKNRDKLYKKGSDGLYYPKF